MKTTITTKKNNLKRLTKVLGIGALLSLGLKANSQCIAGYTSVNDTVNNGNVMFVNSSSIGNSSMTYYWDFGDNTTSSVESPNHTFANSGTYQVCLTISDSNGIMCSHCDNIVIGGQADSICQANFYTYSDSSSTPNSLNFTNYSGGSPVGFSWDFGDGSTSSLENPLHVFVAAGTYQVCLTIVDLNGSTCSHCDNVYIGNPIDSTCNANFYTYADSSNTPNSINFTNYSGGSPTSFSWNFGDNTTSSLENPVHLFAAAGTYQVCLTITNSNGGTCTHCDNVYVGNQIDSVCQANFYTYSDSSSVNSINYADASQGNPSSFSWEFGDGTTSNQAYGNHQYASAGTYQVCLTIADSNGNVICSHCDIITVGAQNDSLCQANFYTYADSSNTPNTIHFSDYSGGTPTNFSWDFGDNTISTLENPTHVYAAAGTYQVCLTIDGANGTTCTHCDIITVGTQIDSICQTNFYSYADSSSAPNTINFVNYSGGTPSSFSWSFGDNTSSTLENPTHVYASAGTYQVCLTIADSSGSSCTHCDNVVVGSQNGGGCQLAYFYSASDSTSSNTVNFGDTSLVAFNSYFWDFGDSTNSTTSNPNHVYADSGTYQVCLTVVDANGNTCTYCSNVAARHSLLAGINDSKSISTALENYPNPFNESTTINYSISKEAAVELTIVDLLGNKIATVENGTKSAGNYSTVWNANNVSSGMFLLQLKVNNQVSTRRIIITK